MTTPLRHLLEGMLRRLAACTGALLLLVMLGGIVESYPVVELNLDGFPEKAVAAAGDIVSADDDPANELVAQCPHETASGHINGECCLGPCCTATVASIAALGSPRIFTALGRCAGPPISSAASGGQFRPPRQLAA